MHPRLVELVFERAPAALVEATAAARTAVVVVGRGSSDPDANGDFCKLARLFGEGRGFAGVLPAFIGITSPLLRRGARAGRARAARAHPGRAPTSCSPGG